MSPPVRVLLRTTMRRHLAAPVLLATLVLGSAACAKHYIPNTDVEDTEANREVIQFAEKYRKAVENRDIGQILAMVSPKYYEDGGNVDASDDLDYEGLKRYLADEFKKAKAIRYEIRYRRITGSSEADRIFVDYTYSASYRIPGVDDEYTWKRQVSDNRLELVKMGDTFQIIAGM